MKNKFRWLMAFLCLTAATLAPTPEAIARPDPPEYCSPLQPPAQPTNPAHMTCYFECYLVYTDVYFSECAHWDCKCQQEKLRDYRACLYGCVHSDGQVTIEKINMLIVQYVHFNN